MSSTPLVSILIPAYNAEQWIGDTLESVLAQSWRRTEIIVVDDGSHDRTLEVAQRFSRKNVLVFAKANQGAAATRNFAYRLCQGDYVQWLDADDLLGPHKIERQIRKAQEVGDQYLLSAPFATFAYCVGRARSERSALWQDLSPVEWLVRKLREDLYMQTATWLTSRRLSEAAGPWDERLLGDDDGEYFCRVLLASAGVKFVEGDGVLYRKLPSGRLSYIGDSEARASAMVLSMRLHIQYVRSLEESARVRAACLAYLCNWARELTYKGPGFRQELAQMATELGELLVLPRTKAKYRILRALLGEAAQMRAQRAFPQIKARCACLVDRALWTCGVGAGKEPIW